jgi:hypothetical protein
MATAKGPFRRSGASGANPTPTTRATTGAGAGPGRPESGGHPTKQAVLLLVGVTALIVLLAVVSSLGHL